jgi:hypothetical protein
MLHVLHTEGVDVATAPTQPPSLGVPVVDAIAVMTERWGMGRVEAGMMLGATLEELRAAGCAAVEVLAAQPREALRSLDARESTWEVAAATLLEAGYIPADAVAHLVAHAPTPDACAAGVAAIIDDAAEAFTCAGRRAQPEDLAAIAQRYGLDATETGQVLVAAGFDATTTAEVIEVRCDHDVAVAVQVCGVVLGDVHARAVGRFDDVIDLAARRQLTDVGVEL